MRNTFAKGLEFKFSQPKVFNFADLENYKHTQDKSKRSCAIIFRQTTQEFNFIRLIWQGIEYWKATCVYLSGVALVQHE